MDRFTGAAISTNPWFNDTSHTDPKVDYFFAKGFRNPFGLRMRPGTNDLWLFEVGDSWSESTPTFTQVLIWGEDYALLGRDIIITGGYSWTGLGRRCPFRSRVFRRHWRHITPLEDKAWHHQTAGTPFSYPCPAG